MLARRDFLTGCAGGVVLSCAIVALRQSGLRSRWRELLTSQDSAGNYPCRPGSIAQQSVPMGAEVAILDREGKRILVSREQIVKEQLVSKRANSISDSDALKIVEQYIIPVEDKRYWEKGSWPIDLRTSAAMLLSLVKGAPRGGSGIIMQAIRIPPYDSQSCGGGRRATGPLEKLKEMEQAKAYLDVLAEEPGKDGEKIGLKKALNKILIHYFQNVPLGPVYGWQAGLEHFFNIEIVEDAKGNIKFSRDGAFLTAGQSASYAAGLLTLARSPSRFRFTKSGYQKNSEELQAYKIILDKLRGADVISQEEYDYALKNPPKLRPKSSQRIDFNREWLLDEANAMQSDGGSLDFENPDPRSITEVNSTLDGKVQAGAVALLGAVRSQFVELGNSGTFEGSILVLNGSGEVLARHGTGPKSQFDYAGLGRFPLNSVMKALIVETAVEMYGREILEQKVFDGTVDVYPEPPENADGKFKGAMTLRDALIQSRNAALCNFWNDPQFNDLKQRVFNKLKGAGITLTDEEMKSSRFPLGFVTATASQLAVLMSPIWSGSRWTSFMSVSKITFDDDSIQTMTPLGAQELDETQQVAAGELNGVLKGVLQAGGTAVIAGDILGDSAQLFFAKTGSGPKSATLVIGSPDVLIVVYAQASQDIKGLYSSNTLVAPVGKFLNKYILQKTDAEEPGTSNSGRSGNGGAGVGAERQGQPKPGEKKEERKNPTKKQKGWGTKVLDWLKKI